MGPLGLPGQAPGILCVGGGGGEGANVFCLRIGGGGCLGWGVCACEGRGGRVYKMSVKVSSNVFTNYWSQ